MEKKRKESKFLLRPKSPILTTTKRKMELTKCNILSISDVDGLDTISTEIQDTDEHPANSPIIHPTKSLKHLNVCGNLQSTPNNRNSNKSSTDSRTIMNLSPIISISSEKTIGNNFQDSFKKDALKSSLPNVKNRKEYNKLDTFLKNNGPIKKPTNECNIQNLPILPVNIKETKEITKRCLFENEKTDSISNFNTDQDSLNISLDILEQVCQVSEMIDNSSTELVQISDNADQKKNKLAFFLYGNDNSTKLDETKEENELLQLALSMEDNLLTEVKSNNKLSFEGTFTSLNQLNDKKINLSENDITQCKKENLSTHDCLSKFNFIDSEVINDIENTQMCEIADMTEPLESFDDQWTQQYYNNSNNNVSHLTNAKEENNLNDSLKITKIVPDAVLRSPINCIHPKDNVRSKECTKVQSISKYERGNLSTTTYQKTNTSSNMCKGFSTALGKSIKVSDDALKKVQSMLKDELDCSLTSHYKTITYPNVCEGFSTAGGKSIKVSEKTLQKSQSILKDELNYSLVSTNDKTITNFNVCKGFSTAGGKPIKISDNALQKVQSMLKNELDNSLASINDKTITNFNVYEGFSTAGGKSIKVSDNVLQKVQLMLKDELDGSLISSYDKITNLKVHKGVSTTGGKSNNVLDQTLQKPQSILKNELDNSLAFINDKTITNFNVCEGFSTAGGKSIKVSDNALQKVQFMLKDELDGSLISSNDKITNSKLHKGVSTTEGKSISVSHKTLQKPQSMLKNELDNFLASINDKTITNVNVCEGFSTAGGKSIKVSDNALQKVQFMLKDELNGSLISSYDKITNPNVYKGFSTTGDEFIQISDTAIKKRELMLKNDLRGLQLFNYSLETININTDSINTNEGLNSPKLSIESSSKSTFLECLKNDEEFALEDLSLIDTVEKFERDQNECKPTLRNKRPGSPTYEMNHTLKRTAHDEIREHDALKTSFNVYLSKKLNRPQVLLPEAVDWIKPKTQHSKVPKYGPNIELLKVNTNNALNLKLYWNNQLSDGNKNKSYNFQDIKTFFLSHNFVDAKLVPKRWIENHFRLIVWKLAATEISFPNYFEKKLLTAENILHQLLLRYYREIEKCQRSALKKILEKDESASKRIVLYVSKVIKTNIAGTYNIELSDGWYCVQGLIDFEMNVLLHKGIVKVGTKLMIYNAELIGAREGIDPLNVHDGIKLKISTNSTRRVRWYTKLGFYKNGSLPIPITLESVLSRGGAIGSLSLVILRKYPLMYFERNINSKSILRNEKTEAIEAEKYEAYKQKSLEIISNKVETELISEMASTNKNSEKCILRIKKENIDELSIEDLSNMIENSIDPLEIQSLLSQEKLDAVNNYKKCEQERFYIELQKRVNQVFNDQFKDARKVIPLFKLRVVDEKNASTGLKSAILTIWNPSEDIFSILNKSCEGQYCRFHHLATNGFKNGELQISANKNTRFDFQEFKSEYVKRDVINFKDIWSDNFLPLFGELDFVGIVISNINKIGNGFNEIYVSDKEMNIISIIFQSDIKEYGCDDLMSPGNIIFAANIQFKGFSPISSIPKLYNTERSLFTSIPKAEHILKIFNDYKIFMKKSENQDFLKCCQIKLNEIGGINMEITKITKEDSKQQSLNTSKNAFNRSYGELSMTVVKASNTSQTEYSPAQKRIKMLNNYGKPPPLNILHTKPPDKKLMSQFKTPTRHL